MRYYLQSKAHRWNGDTLELLWCVVDKKGSQLSRWISKRGAEIELGKLLSARIKAARRKSAKRRGAA